MKICNSRFSTESVMNHQGFGDLYITIKGNRFLVPEDKILPDGRIDKSYIKALRRKAVA